jgi:adenosylhomocysteine nucleosidase
MSKIVIIAAMERELAPLVRRWKKSAFSAGGKKFIFFENENVVAIISGIGSKNAELAARAAVERFQPSGLVSAGLAGALIRSLKVGSVFLPNIVVDAADGAEYRCSADGEHITGGVLVSASEIAGTEIKQQLVQNFHALVVDMEAAGVAKVALEANIDFRCVKAISDEADFVMPPMAQFIDASGHFQSGKFAAWVTLRPWHWTKVAALATNSKRATQMLCDWLAKNLTGRMPSGEVVTLKRAEFSEAKR